MEEKKILYIIKLTQNCILKLKDIYGKDSGTYYTCLEILAKCNQLLMENIKVTHKPNVEITKIKTSLFLSLTKEKVEENTIDEKTVSNTNQ